MFGYTKPFQTDKSLKKYIDKIEYEEVLVKMCSIVKVYVNKISNLIWSEIDTVDHLKNVVKNIYLD